MHTYKQVQIIQLNTNKILQTCGNTQKHVELTGRSTEVSSRRKTVVCALNIWVAFILFTKITNTQCKNSKTSVFLRPISKTTLATIKHLEMPEGRFIANAYEIMYYFFNNIYAQCSESIHQQKLLPFTSPFPANSKN